jgi:endonuclease IV
MFVFHFVNYNNPKNHQKFDTKPYFLHHYFQKYKKLVKNIDLIHFNDSKDGFESSRDRHENLGKGNIPKAELEYVIKNCKSDIVVETPGGLEAQKKDIAWIKRRLKK